MLYEILLFGAGFLCGWLVFERPDLIEEHVVEPLKKWWKGL